MNLAGKVALVSGSGRGIGLGCALELARRGAELVINDRPGSDELTSAAEQIRALDGLCHCVAEDVFSREGCERLTTAAVGAAGRIDILVSNPAYGCRGEFLNYPVEEFERTLNGTLTSGFLLSQLVARRMIEQAQGGKIIFISSVQAELPMARSFAYGAAKAGLNHMMRSIAVELSSHRINVNAVEPGWIDTPNERREFGAETVEREGARLPWGRIGSPADIGNAVAFLASPDADYITGEVLAVDGLFRYKDFRPENAIPSEKENGN